MTAADIEEIVRSTLNLGQEAFLCRLLLADEPVIVEATDAVAGPVSQVRLA